MRTRREEGFALPITIFIVTLVTIMLSALFVRVGVERRIAESSGATVDALAIAHSGLQRYYVHYDSLDTMPADGDSMRVNVSGGYADVVAHIAYDPPAGDRMYLVRSTGHVIEPTQGADPQAVRTVAQFAVWQEGAIERNAAFLAANRFQDPDVTDDAFPPSVIDASPDGAVSIYRSDQCGLSGPALRGLKIPSGNHTMDYGVGGQHTFDAAPEESGLASTVASSAYTGIDWPGVIGGDFLPDYTTFTNWNTWSSYLITTPLLTLNDIVGSGLLVVTGDLVIQGSTFDWRGVILVGGRISFNATTMNVSGMVVSGLQFQVAPPAPPIGYWPPAGTSLTIQYNSCRADSAMAALAGLAPIPNAWVDNWATY